MKRALIVGINDYPTAPLRGCVPDAHKMYDLLSKHGNGEPNFGCRLLTSEKEFVVTKSILEDQLEELLMQPADAAIFYFSGHGSKNVLGGFMITQDATRASQGLSFDQLQRLVRKSPVKEITIILDCCYSGRFGDGDDEAVNLVELREGVTIMAACRSTQQAKESGEGGLFTSLIANALEGEAADITGSVTLAGIYHHVDGLLTAWDQRPMFKAHVSQMSPIRSVPPAFHFHELQRLIHLFPAIDYEIRLSPEYEYTAEPRNAEKESEFAELQKFRAYNLVEPQPPYVHMYLAAMAHGRCRLTPLGRFYWRMVKQRCP